MNNNDKNFNLLINQRYYHFITLKKNVNDYSFDDFWNNLDSLFFDEDFSENIESDNYEIQHKRLKSNQIFPRGNLINAISFDKVGNPPYQYDLFAIKTILEGEIYFVFVFPFSLMARIIVNDLINRNRLRQKCDILAVKVPNFILKKELNIDNDINIWVVGLDMVIKDDEDLSLLKIGGDKPLNSILYKNYVLNNISSKYFYPYKCSVACELFSENPEFYQPIVRSRIHLDVFGNYKFYIHIDGKNLLLIPNLIKRFIKINCMDIVAINPLLRQEIED